MAKTRFKLKKVSNYGSSHPVVARLLLQTHDLLQWANLPKDDKDAVYTIYDRLNKRLLKCHEAFDRLVSARHITIRESEFQVDGSSKYEPHVIGLEEEVETILYESKNYLRDLLGILNIFFDYECDEASYFYNAKGNGVSPLVKWASERFGDEDPFTRMLANEHEWIEALIRNRNAVEHPGGHSGTLHIQNFTILKDGRYLAPTWNRDDEEPKDLYQDIGVILDNLLSLAEEFLVSCNVHKAVFDIIKYVQIPEQDRDPECPKRIIVQLEGGIGVAKAD